MKLRHAAAVALVGWYLMLPPWGFSDERHMWWVDRSAPLTQWTTFGSYDTARECNSDAAWLRRSEHAKAKKSPVTTEELTKRSELPPWNVMMALSALQADAGLCIASDDPRLKPK